MGVYGGRGHDPGVRGGVFSVGSYCLCGERGCVWVGVVGACGGGAGGVFVGVCESYHLPLFFPLFSFWAEYPGYFSGLQEGMDGSGLMRAI